MGMDTYAEATLAQVFRNRTATYRKAIRWKQKIGDTWVAKTWAENQAIVNNLISGLDALGVRQGDVVGILSNTRWEWTATDWALIGLGAVSVTIYPSNLAALCAFIINDSGASYVFAENRDQYEKLRSIRDQIPAVRKVILFDDAEQYTGDSWVMSFAELQRLSARSPKEADDFAARRAAEVRPEDRMTLVYTSGTTGNPKGVVHTHATFMAQVIAIRKALNTIRPRMVDLLFLPLSHVFGREEHLCGVDLGLSTVISPSLDHLIEDMKVAKPDLFFSVPRIYERAYATIQAQVLAGSSARQRIFRWAERLGIKVAEHREFGKRVPLGLRARYAVADRLVFKKIRAALGGNLKFAVTAAAPLDVNILQFFNAAGVLLLEGWGLTETSGGFTVNRVHHYRFGSVGLTFDGHETRIADDGEILVRGPCIFIGYQNNPEATAEAIDPDGWFHTGDIGTLDAEGFLRIVDRKKDLIITAAGKNIAPQNVENTLKRAPLVSQVAVYGDRKPYLVALITLDPEQVRAWCAERGIPYTSMAEVYTNPQLLAYVDVGIQAANKELASYETVKYYDVLPIDFTVENELLTPTLKVRRRNIHALYHDQYEALYHPTKHDTAQGTS